MQVEKKGLSFDMLMLNLNPSYVLKVAEGKADCREVFGFSDAASMSFRKKCVAYVLINRIRTDGVQTKHNDRSLRRLWNWLGWY